MRNRFSRALTIAALIEIGMLGAASAAPELPSADAPRSVPRIPLLIDPNGPLGPGSRPFDPAPPLPPGHPVFGPDGAFLQPPSAQPPQAARPPAPAEPAPKPPTRAEQLDRLLGRLARTSDAAEAQGIASLIQQMWMHSGSDTADLLMTRAMSAMNGNRRDVAEVLLDQIIVLRPEWAEAWNKRATLRFLENDDAGSMEDISHVLNLEPRHFGALSGMGFILERHGEDAAALKALNRVLEVYPQDADVRKAVEKLKPSVEGQSL